MNKIWTIIKREYRENVFKKSFIISTILTPVLMLGMVFIPALLADVEVEQAVRIDVLDHSGMVYSELSRKLDEKLEDGSPRYLLRSIQAGETQKAQAFEQLKDQVNREEIDGYLYIPSQIIDSLKFSFFARNVANFDLNRTLRQSVNEIVQDERISRSGLDPEVVSELSRQVDLQTIKIKKGESEKEAGFFQEYISTVAFVMILYITILLYGAAIMRGIIQEKSSRIIEVLLSSCNSFQLMAGKILGLGSVGLTQYMLWSVFGMALMAYTGSQSSMSMMAFSPEIFIYFVVFFILGYFLFATMYAAIAALSNSDQEAQQMSFPVVMLLIIPIVMMTFIIKNPESTLAVVLSQIPFFSPIIMFMRINISNPTGLEVASSIGLLVLTIIGLIWLVARIYRIGILMYGKRPNLPEIIRWIRTK